MQKYFLRIHNKQAQKKIEEKLNIKLLYGCHLYIKKASTDDFLFDFLNYDAQVIYKKKNRKYKVIDTENQKGYFLDGIFSYYQEKKYPYLYIEIYTDLNIDSLSQIFEQKITEKTKSINCPKIAAGLGNKAWLCLDEKKPNFPIYVISKGRPNCITAKALNKLCLDYKIIVEKEEAQEYKKIHNDRVFVGDFDNYNQSSIPVRNYIDRICSSDYYWILDDNIEDFNILHSNQKYVSRTGSIFSATEDFIQRFKNVGQAGFNYYSFAKKNDCVPPYYTNTRIYSCILMNKNTNEIIKSKYGQLWRGRYNEDTDLSIRILKENYCTVLMNCFLAGKVTTQRMKGGNTDNVYTDDDNRFLFADSLRQKHPDIVRVTKKFGRYHHQVNYKIFKQKLQVKDNYQDSNYHFYIDNNAR